MILDDHRRAGTDVEVLAVARLAVALISVVTTRLHSDVSRRGYRATLRQFLAWHLFKLKPRATDRSAVRWSSANRVALESRRLAPSTINQDLSAIRTVADQCPESGLLDSPTAAALAVALKSLNRSPQDAQKPEPLAADHQAVPCLRGFVPGVPHRAEHRPHTRGAGARVRAALAGVGPQPIHR